MWIQSINCCNGFIDDVVQRWVFPTMDSIVVPATAHFKFRSRLFTVIWKEFSLFCSFVLFEKSSLSLLWTTCLPITRVIDNEMAKKKKSCLVSHYRFIPLLISFLFFRFEYVRAVLLAVSKLNYNIWLSALIKSFLCRASHPIEYFISLNFL